MFNIEFRGSGSTRLLQLGYIKSDKTVKPWLKVPNVFPNPKGWYLLLSEAFGAIWKHYKGIFRKHPKFRI